MKTLLLTAATMVVIAGTCAQAGTIKPSQALSNQGQLVIVEGTANVHTDAGRSGVDVELVGTDNSHMTAFIPQQSVNVFPALDTFDGKHVNVTGVVVFNGGKVEIRLMRANQLKLAEP